MSGDPANKTVIVFGPNGGLGRALSRVYAVNGWNVVEVTRQRCDFTSSDSVRRLCDELSMSEFKIDTCIFAPGILYAGYLPELNPDDFFNSLAVNSIAPITISLNFMKFRRPVERFVYVGSGAARLFLPGLSFYSLSKRLLADFVRFGQLELSPSQFRPLVVWPGGMNTDFNKNARLKGRFKILQNFRARSPEAVAERIYRADVGGRSTLNLSRMVFILGFIQSLIPLSWFKILIRHRTT